MAHKGTKEFNNQELSTIALGQLGFAVLINNGTTTEYLASTYGVEYFTEFKCVEALSSIKARAYQAGSNVTPRDVRCSIATPDNNFAEDYVKQRALGSNANEDMDYDQSSIGVSLANGSSIYGAFDKGQLGGNSYIMAYLGPNIN